MHLGRSYDNNHHLQCIIQTVLLMKECRAVEARNIVRH